ncbi:MAG: alpha/beta hydrolase [Phycisphaeraceae bacterium]
MGLLIFLVQVVAVIVVVGSLGLCYALLHPPRKGDGYALGRRLPLDPGALGLAFVDQTFTLPDGTTTASWLIQGGDRDAPTLVVTHGWGDGRHDMLARYEPIWQDLAKQCTRIVIYDVRGHGESTARISHLSIAEPDDLRAILDQLDAQAAHAGESRYMLWGCSMGANVSIVAAGREARDMQGWGRTSYSLSLRGPRERPGVRVTGSSNTSNHSAGHGDPKHPHPIPLPQKGEGTGKAACDCLRPRICGVIADGPYRHAVEPLVGILRQRRYPPYPFAHLSLAIAGLFVGGFVDFDRARHAARLRAPLLVLHGDGDAICPLASAQAIAAAAPDGQLVEFPNAGHLDLAQRQPARYLGALTELLQRVRHESAPLLDARKETDDQPRGSH